MIFLLFSARKKQSIRKEYLSGKYGGVPVLEIENIEA
jgi:hypothetical protein